MGQKVNPIGLRIGLTTNWRSRWFAKKDYAQFLKEDLDVRSYILGKLFRAGISRIEIERAGDKLRVDIHAARPGIVIGKRGSEVDVLRTDLEKKTKKQVQINIQEVRRPELDATLVAQSIAEQLQARISFRRAMKKAVTAAIKGGTLGIKVAVSGRLGGSEMSRSEWYREGRVPLHTLRANIDYGFAEAKTTFGRIGVKVWIYKGDVLPGQPIPEREAPRRGMARPGSPRAADEAREARRRAAAVGGISAEGASAAEAGKTSEAPAGAPAAEDTGVVETESIDFREPQDKEPVKATEDQEVVELVAPQEKQPEAAEEAKKPEAKEAKKAEAKKPEAKEAKKPEGKTAPKSKAKEKTQVKKEKPTPAAKAKPAAKKTDQAKAPKKEPKEKAGPEEAS